MAPRLDRPSVPKKKPVKPLVPTPPRDPDPKFYTMGLVHRGPKPAPSHPVARARGYGEDNAPEVPIKGKTYRSDTGGTVTVGKSAALKKTKGTAMPDASQHDTSRLKYFGKGA
jgi:hypothetical protein